MPQKLIYFTADTVPTVDETAEIAALKAMAAPRYEVFVRNRLGSQQYGAGAESFDVVAGTPPDGDLYDEADVVLPGDEVTIRDGFALEDVTPSGEYTDTVTFTVEDGEITAIVLS